MVRVIGPQQWECELCVSFLFSLPLFFFFFSAKTSSRPNGVTFVAPAGTSEFAKRWTPKVGDVVSFKHRGFLAGSGRPKLPTVHRLRPELSWNDVVNMWKEKKPSVSGKALSSSCLMFSFFASFFIIIFLPSPLLSS